MPAILENIVTSNALVTRYRLEVEAHRGTARRNETNKYKALFEIKIRSHGFEGLPSNRQSQLEKEVYSYRESLYIDSLY